MPPRVDWVPATPTPNRDVSDGRGKYSETTLSGPRFYDPRRYERDVSGGGGLIPDQALASSGPLAEMPGSVLAWTRARLHPHHERHGPLVVSAHGLWARRWRFAPEIV